jgi:hypothetical protein
MISLSWASYIQFCFEAWITYIVRVAAARNILERRTPTTFSELFISKPWNVSTVVRELARMCFGHTTSDSKKINA